MDAQQQTKVIAFQKEEITNHYLYLRLADTIKDKHNAGVIRGLRDSHGGFARWLDAHHPRPKADWVKLFKKTFRFTGGEITGEFLMSLGYLPGAHRPDCPVMKRIAKARRAR